MIGLLGTHAPARVTDARKHLLLTQLRVLAAWPLSCLLVQGVPMGLAGLVQSELGQELDKTLQCSAWGKRPLSHEQVR